MDHECSRATRGQDQNRDGMDDNLQLWRALVAGHDITAPPWCQEAVYRLLGEPLS